MDSSIQKFLDANQYSKKSILRYERIFGHGWVSTGGEQTTKDFCLEMGLRPFMNILDIGCGTGGSSMYMARQYGCSVHGLDLSNNMIKIAQFRLEKEEEHVKNLVEYSIRNVFEANFEENLFDIIYSRDVILHIDDKIGLFKKILPWLKPGGTLFITDYMFGTAKSTSEQFKNYVKSRGYHLTTVSDYGKLIEEAGFKNVQARDMSEMFISVLSNELKYFEPTKEAFIKEFSSKDFDEISNGWKSKIENVKAKYQSWGLFMATK